MALDGSHSPRTAGTAEYLERIQNVRRIAGPTTKRSQGGLRYRAVAAALLVAGIAMGVAAAAIALVPDSPFAQVIIMLCGGHAV